MDLNWHDRIQRAIKNGGRFLPDDITRACDWCTCACGEQDPRIPRLKDGSPIDDEMWNHGEAFANAVNANKPEKAQYLLGEIEARGEIVVIGQVES